MVLSFLILASWSSSSTTTSTTAKLFIGEKYFQERIDRQTLFWEGRSGRSRSKNFELWLSLSLSSNVMTLDLIYILLNLTFHGLIMAVILMLCQKPKKKVVQVSPFIVLSDSESVNKNTQIFLFFRLKQKRKTRSRNPSAFRIYRNFEFRFAIFR